jgi:hypothetical protein
VEESLAQASQDAADAGGIGMAIGAFVGAGRILPPLSTNGCACIQAAGTDIAVVQKTFLNTSHG